MVHRLDAGDHTGAADAFLMWVHPPELASRRRAERAQFLRSDAPAPPPPSPPPPTAPGFWARIVALLTRKAA